MSAKTCGVGRSTPAAHFCRRAIKGGLLSLIPYPKKSVLRFLVVFFFAEKSKESSRQPGQKGIHEQRKAVAQNLDDDGDGGGGGNTIFFGNRDNIFEINPH